MSDADWEKQKTLVTQQANWMIGSTRVTQEHWADAEKALRASLASTPHGTEMAAALLSNLGWTNYKLRNIPEALKLYQQCSAIHSAFQARRAPKYPVDQVRVQPPVSRVLGAARLVCTPFLSRQVP